MIFSMKDEQDTIQWTPDLLKHATKFYKELFGPAPSSGIKLSDDMWGVNEKLSTEDRAKLDWPFCEK